MIPSRGPGYWSLYVWDVQKRMVHVFDPVVANGDPEEMWGLHGGFIQKIASAMTACKNVFFTGWDVDFQQFPEQFFLIEENESNCADSAMYIIHYMRWFDGENITQPITKKTVRHLRKTLPYELLIMRGNRGSVPRDLMEKLSVATA
ncbi:unnamed protein product [Urochloa humidicola]